MPDHQILYYRHGLLALRIKLQGKYVIEIEFIDPNDPQIDVSHSHPYLKKVDEYVRGKSKNLDLPYLIQTTEFKNKVYEATRQIPSGKTASYGEIAALAGSPKAARAVGAAMASNPLPLIIPCHRVLGSTGKLTGFGGGLHIKEMLLELERNK